MARANRPDHNFRQFPANNPNPVFMVTGKSVVYANAAARRLMADLTGKRGNRLPDAFHDPVGKLSKRQRKASAR